MFKPWGGAKVQAFHTKGPSFNPSLLKWLMSSEIFLCCLLVCFLLQAITLGFTFQEKDGVKTKKWLFHWTELEKNFSRDPGELLVVRFYSPELNRPIVRLSTRQSHTFLVILSYVQVYLKRCYSEHLYPFSSDGGQIIFQTRSTTLKKSPDTIFLPWKIFCPTFVRLCVYLKWPGLLCSKQVM